MVSSPVQSKSVPWKFPHGTLSLRILLDEEVQIEEFLLDEQVQIEDSANSLSSMKGKVFWSPCKEKEQPMVIFDSLDYVVLSFLSLVLLLLNTAPFTIIGETRKVKIKAKL